MAGYLLDTNVLSEAMRPRPESRVMQWIAAQSAAELHLSAISLSELARGVRRLPAGQRRSAFSRWLADDLQRQFASRILPYDREAALIWGEIMADAERRGRPRAAIDGQIAAIAIKHRLWLVTRNIADFEGLPVRTIDPWAED